MKKGAKFQVKNTETGAIKSKGTSKGSAERQVRLLQAIEHGYKTNK